MGRFSGLNRMLISVERCENFTKIHQEKYPTLITFKNLLNILQMMEKKLHLYQKEKLHLMIIVLNIDQIIL